MDTPPDDAAVYVSDHGLVRLRDIESVEWASGRKGWTGGYVEIMARHDDAHMLHLDIRQAGDFAVYMLFKDRFGLD